MARRRHCRASLHSRLTAQSAQPAISRDSRQQKVQQLNNKRIGFSYGVRMILFQKSSQLFHYFGDFNQISSHDFESLCLCIYMCVRGWLIQRAYFCIKKIGQFQVFALSCQSARRQTTRVFQQSIGASIQQLFDNCNISFSFQIKIKLKLNKKLFIIGK